MAQGDLILAADFGTSGVKLGALTPDLRLIASASEPYPLSLPAPSCAEQAPEDWWNALARAIATLTREVQDLPGRTASLVFCGQMCGLVCAGADGKALRPALVWLDKRAGGLMRKHLGGFPSLFGYRVNTGLRWAHLANGAPSLNGMDPLGKMLWIKQFEPQTYERSACFLDVKDWLVHRATGEFTTTADSANLTWLMDTRPGREGWSAALARQSGLDLGKMPRIVEGDSVVAGLCALSAGQLGLRAGTPVVAGGGDVSATAIGSGAVGDGEMHLCLSTSAWVAGFMTRRVLSPRHSYATITSSLAHRPLLIATQESAGSSLGWLAETIDPVRHAGGEALADFYADLGAARADDPLFLPWLAGERVPIDEERLRGGFHGLSLRHDQNALKRGMIEGIALNTLWAWSSVIRQKGVRDSGTVPIVGGAADNPALVQAIADALGRQVRVGDTRFSGVLGAAAMAMPSLGWAGSVWEAAGILAQKGGPVHDPDTAGMAMMAERNARLAEVRRAMIRLYRQSGKEQAT